jgi:hypothetical protein
MTYVNMLQFSEKRASRRQIKLRQVLSADVKPFEIYEMLYPAKAGDFSGVIIFPSPTTTSINVYPFHLFRFGNEDRFPVADIILFIQQP